MKKDFDLISVIVPVYNVDKYLKKCINSITEQTYSNLEIIIIDDGSTDNSGIICDDLAKTDSRIIVIHKSNGGLSSARNKGLDVAKGQLVCFIDSDDFIEINMISELKDNMIKYDSDISTCNYYSITVDNNKKIIRHYNILENVFSDKEKFNNLENEYDALTVYAWNKLFKKSLFNGIRFPENKIYEFTYILCELLDRANKVSYITKPLYNYVYRSDSISNTFTINHFDRIASYNKKIDFLELKGYDDLALIEKRKKAITLIKYITISIDLKILLEKYYIHELYKTIKDIKWKDSNKHIRLFKLFGMSYIRFRVLEIRVWKVIKKIIRKK